MCNFEKTYNMLNLYKQQTACLVAVDSIIFGFDGENLKLLLVKRGLEDDTNTWSLMGGWLKPDEGLNDAAHRVLFEHTGLRDVYLEQIAAFGNPDRDPVMRTVSVTTKPWEILKNIMRKSPINLPLRGS